MDALVRRSGSRERLEVIWRRKSGVGHPGANPREPGLNPTVVCRRSTEPSVDDLLVVAVDAGSRTIRRGAAHRECEVAGEFHQILAQRAELGRSDGGARGSGPQFMVEHMSGGHQEPAQPLSEDERATGAAYLQTMMQRYYPTLRVAAGAVDSFVQIPRRLMEFGEGKSEVVVWLAAKRMHTIGVDGHAAAAFLPACAVEGAVVDMRDLAGLSGRRRRDAHQAHATAWETFVFAQFHHVRESGGLKKDGEFGEGKADSETEPDPYPQQDRSQPRKRSIEDTDRAERRARVAEAEHVFKQKLMRLVVQGLEPNVPQTTSYVVVTVGTDHLLIACRSPSNRNAFDSAFQAQVVPFDHRVEQCNLHPVELHPTKDVLGSRELEARDKIFALESGANTEKLLDGIGLKMVRMVGTRVAAAYRIKGLAHHIHKHKVDLARMTAVVDVADQQPGQFGAPVACLQQHRLRRRSRRGANRTAS